MENASKALIMAGGVLIAIIIIGALSGTMLTVSKFQKSQLSEEEQTQLVKYNEQFTKYIGQYMYGTEIMTIINKYNDSYNSGMSYPLNIKVSFKTAFIYNEIKRFNGVETSTSKTVNELDLSATSTFFAVTTSSLESFRNRAFRCTQVEYDANGRINKIIFQEI